jgi:hypothetical protein
VLHPMLRQKSLCLLGEEGSPSWSKNADRVIKAQKMTTKRSQVIVAGQLRWHVLIEDGMSRPI